MSPDFLNKAGTWGVIALITYAVYVGLVAGPIGTVEGKKLVPTKSSPVLIARHSDIDHTVKITHVPSGDELILYVSSGELYTDPETLQPLPHDNGPGKLTMSPKWDAKVERQVPLLKVELDVGTYAGFIMGASNGVSPFDVGIRVSPCRLFETFSPDLLIGREAAGFGISAFPPPEIFGHVWSHAGVGLGYVWEYAGGAGHVMPYASFSVTF